MSRPSRYEGPVLVLTGPTSTGKTALSIELSHRRPIEIISMDSRQVYVGMDIGTDKASPQERVAIPHHGLDLVAPDERYSAGQFSRDARRWIEGIRSRGALPVIAGGTGFFLKSLLNPIFTEPELETERRDRLRNWTGVQERETLERYVRALDRDRADIAIEGGPQRMARTIEVALLTGVPLSRWHRVSPPEAPGVPAVVVLLDLPREELHRRISIRVDRMIARGLEDEVRRLLDMGYGDAAPGMTGTGYREMARFVRGEATLQEAKDAISSNTRKYARRQRTWFRHQLPDHAVTVDATQSVHRQAELALTALDTQAIEKSE
ncbi:MAG: tRNA (adenosine(37)-N6)-dimethylallyltransferase MiaA [Gemmatimonadota bacterium]|nr:tRNA (adenosine(37)-N6)-dimethylallyltransferase MiaA [Gemmatimonadota bacterium]MDE3004780.1 tRNA (adenosine(37)-N6)-dimethylallyltransferase MiaA [Gemmatimonadota bacterium]